MHDMGYFLSRVLHTLVMLADGQVLELAWDWTRRSVAVQWAFSSRGRDMCRVRQRRALREVRLCGAQDLICG